MEKNKLSRQIQGLAQCPEVFLRRHQLKEVEGKWKTLHQLNACSQGSRTAEVEQLCTWQKPNMQVHSSLHQRVKGDTNKQKKIIDHIFYRPPLNLSFD